MPRRSGRFSSSRTSNRSTRFHIFPVSGSSPRIQHQNSSFVQYEPSHASTGARAVPAGLASGISVTTSFRLAASASNVGAEPSSCVPVSSMFMTFMHAAFGAGSWAWGTNPSSFFLPASGTPLSENVSANTGRPVGCTILSTCSSSGNRSSHSATLASTSSGWLIHMSMIHDSRWAWQ